MQWHGTIIRLSAKHADQIQKGFKKAFNADDIAASFVAAHLGHTEITSQQARDWAHTHITPDKTALIASLKPLYADGYVLGEAVGNTLLNRANKAVQPKVDVGVVDWETWKPGNRAASALLKPKGGLQALLDRRGLTIDGISNTSLDRIGNVLYRALRPATETTPGGLTPREIAPLIDKVIDDPQRALTIAQTEMSRAVSVASRDLYETSGVEQVEWLVAEGCEDCQENADASPIGINDTFPTGDTEPPAHPNCMCALAPYMNLGE